MATKMTGYEANLERALNMLRGLPRWTVNRQRLSMDLYRKLAQGKPVSPESLAESLAIPTGEVRDLLEHKSIKGLVLYDAARRIVGFRGLSLAPTHHRLEVGGRRLFAWCAMDTLFLPEVLGERVRVDSPCPHNGGVIRLTLTPEGLGTVDPAETVVSFRNGDGGVFETDPASIIATFCHFVFFLASPEAGSRWSAEHPGSFLLTLEQAFGWGRRFNAAQLGDVLVGGTVSA